MFVQKGAAAPFSFRCTFRARKGRRCSAFDDSRQLTIITKVHVQGVRVEACGGALTRTWRDRISLTRISVVDLVIVGEFDGAHLRGAQEPSLLGGRHQRVGVRRHHVCLGASLLLAQSGERYGVDLRCVEHRRRPGLGVCG